MGSSLRGALATKQTRDPGSPCRLSRLAMTKYTICGRFWGSTHIKIDGLTNLTTGFRRILTSDNCRRTLVSMIENFADRRLKRFYQDGDKAKIQPDLIKRIEFILALLDVTEKSGRS